MSRAAAVLFALAWAAIAEPRPHEGKALFQECEFAAAARVFEHASTEDPGNAEVHFWLGKSYARLAEVSGPLFARRNARKAQAHLERAAQFDPRNREFLIELFESCGFTRILRWRAQPRHGAA